MKPQFPPVRRWWALYHNPHDLPVIFACRADAEEAADPDEYLVEVRVQSVKDYKEDSRVMRAGWTYD